MHIDLKQKEIIVVMNHNRYNFFDTFLALENISKIVTIIAIYGVQNPPYL
jgi:hypothetical protein